MSKNHLFQEFEATSTEAWIDKITKELKGKPVEDLNWVINKDWTIQPFYRKDTTTSIFTGNKSTNNWAISESIIVENIKIANQQTLAALMAGVEAPCFVLQNDLSLVELKELTQGIEFEYITTQFKTKSNSLETIQTFTTLLQEQGKSVQDIVAIFHIDSTTTTTGELNDILNYFKTHPLNHFRIAYTFSSYQGISNTKKELLEIINGGKELFNIVHLKQGFAIDFINQHLCIQASVGTSFFIAIAKIRALKILWANLSKAYGGQPRLLPTFQVATAQEAYTEDQNYNMIRATTQALSAVVGGIDYLTVTPSNILTQQPDAFSYRIARNVQHLLKHESHLQKVVDPAHGSYYVEQLTSDFAEEVWKKL